MKVRVLFYSLLYLTVHANNNTNEKMLLLPLRCKKKISMKALRMKIRAILFRKLAEAGSNNTKIDWIRIGI